MLIKEFRIVMPMTVEEYQVAQLYSVAEASKNETGGGEGIEVVTNEPRVLDNPEPGSLLERYNKGQYTHKIYHLASKVPKWIRLLAPRGALEIKEEAWNMYPYCKTVVTNPEYMKDKFMISIETLHVADKGDSENVHELPPELLEKREVVRIDIAADPVSSSDYKEEEDPRLFKSEKTGRGPLVVADPKAKNATVPDWKQTVSPVMCCYKLVRCEFVWFGLQTRVEKFIMKAERRIFTNFHRQVFCWTDKWYGMTMEDIRALEDKTKEDLDQARQGGAVKGMSEKD